MIKRGLDEYIKYFRWYIYTKSNKENLGKKGSGNKNPKDNKNKQGKNR